MNSSQKSFTQQLQSAWASQGSMLCVGFDPDPKRMPTSTGGKPLGIFEFCRDIADATADVVCAFKPQFAYFASQGAENQLEKLIQHLKDRYPHIPVILDAKRGDIGNTSKMYATSLFEYFGFDAITIDGHDQSAIKEAIDQLWGLESTRPKALIAKTVKGKGVSFMENDNIWHYTRLTPESYARALSEICEG
jgi:orotidine-5'-phosphate decarboxylase